MMLPEKTIDGFCKWIHEMLMAHGADMREEVLTGDDGRAKATFSITLTRIGQSDRFKADAKCSISRKSLVIEQPMSEFNVQLSLPGVK
jgi:hypothetical protein